MVTGLRHVLFVVADSSTTPILYMALVEFPDNAIDAYKQSLLKWTPLFAWMHDPQARAPTNVPRELVEAVESHLPMARALRQHISSAPAHHQRRAARCLLSHEIGRRRCDVLGRPVPVAAHQTKLGAIHGHGRVPAALRQFRQQRADSGERQPPPLAWT